ncbi:MAG: hypothetical protein GY803_29965 [Chloroflexi bacterium]|nr:hypothetical protein [Chloroflexota bacterium]
MAKRMVFRPGQPAPLWTYAKLPVAGRVGVETRPYAQPKFWPRHPAPTQFCPTPTLHITET